MLTFNNKILTVSNKGLEVEAGPTPPPVGPVLLYTQPVASYTDTVGQTTTLMSGHTWDTTKSVICYKMSVSITPHSNVMNWAKFRALKLYEGSNWNEWFFGRVTSSGLSAQDNSAFFEPLYYNDNTYGIAGPAGVRTSAGDSTIFISNPNTLMSDSSQTEFKIIFDKVSQQVLAYIDGKRVEVIDYSSLSIDMSTWPITNVTYDGQSTSTTYNFGIDVYACDSIFEAEGV